MLPTEKSNSDRQSHVDISMMEMSKVIPYLFDQFQVELVNPEQPLTEKCA